jgi:hypothetical protein
MFTTIYFGGNGCSPISTSITDGFSFADDTTPGTYDNGNDSLVVTDTTTVPEPSSNALMLTGLGLIAVLPWKRRQDALRQSQAD